MSRMRVFLAVEIDPAVRQAAATLQAALGKVAGGVRWADPVGFHITLQFLGEVDDRDLHGVCRAADRVCRTVPPFAVRLAGVGAFPNLRRPRTVWAGVGDGAAELQALFAGLEPPLLELGCYRRENRAYTPHLTLGRTTADDGGGDELATALAKHRDWTAGPSAVEELVVFTSQLRRAGPEYTPVGRAALRGRAEPPLRPVADPSE